MYATSPDVIESTPALAMQIMPQKTSRAVVGGGGGLCLSAWEHELGDDFDKEFILTGVREGFHIIDENSSPGEAAAPNHPSAMPTSARGALFAQASEQIKVEILHGDYVEVKTVPLVISPLGVIEKPGGGIRIIHDCSRPPGVSVNDYAPDLDKQRFQSVDCAAKLMKPGWFMAKVDLKSAYRYVNISARARA